MNEWEGGSVWLGIGKPLFVLESVDIFWGGISMSGADFGDELVDEKVFSPMALFGFLLSLIGWFSVYSQNFLPIAFIALLLGAIPLVFSKLWGIGGFSKFLASLAVIFALFPSSWALSARYFEQKRLVDNAKEFALAYFGLLQEGNLDAAYRLSTSQYTALYANDETSKTAPAAAYESVENNGDEKAAFQSRAGILHSLKRGKQAKWTCVGVSSYRVDELKSYIGLSFQDRSLPNPLTLNIMLVREPPREQAPNEYMWYVAQTEWVEKKSSTIEN